MQMESSFNGIESVSMGRIGVVCDESFNSDKSVSQSVDRYCGVLEDYLFEHLVFLVFLENRRLPIPSQLPVHLAYV